MTTNEERLLAGLKALASSETRAPSAQLEARVFAQLQPKRPRYLWPAVLVATAAALGCAAIFVSARAPKPLVTIRSTAPHEIREQPAAAQTHRALNNKRPRYRPSGRATAQAEDLQLMRIPYAADIQSTDRTELLRVNIPASQLLFWGFPISGTDPNVRVDAEVLVGQDGLARAVRVVQTGESK